MPLKKSPTEQAVRQNTQREIAAGRPPAQAYAIAKSVQREAQQHQKKSK